MFPNRKTLLALVAGATALAFASPALAGTVVASSGPSASTYPVGSQIGDTQRITLREGDTLTVLDNGRTRVLRGPGSFVLASRTARRESRTFAALTNRSSAGRARTGASRNADGVVLNPNLWWVDVSKSGTVCLANPDPIQLWRGDTQEAEVYTVTRAGASEGSVMVDFPVTETLGIWRSALQVREGETYTIRENGSSEAAQVNFVFLQEIPTDSEELALTLIENGCTVQLEQMAAVLEE